MKTVLTCIAVFLFFYPTKAQQPQQSNVVKTAYTTFVFDGRQFNCQVLLKTNNNYDIILYDQIYKLRDTLKDNYAFTPFIFENFCSKFLVTGIKDKIKKTLSIDSILIDKERNNKITFNKKINILNDAILSTQQKATSDSIKIIQLKNSSDTSKEIVKNIDSLTTALKTYPGNIAALRDDISKVRGYLYTSALNYEELRGDSTILAALKKPIDTSGKSIDTLALKFNLFKENMMGLIFQDLTTQLLTDPESVLNIAQVNVLKNVPLYTYYHLKFKKRIENGLYRKQVDRLKGKIRSEKESDNIIDSLFNKIIGLKNEHKIAHHSRKHLTPFIKNSPDLVTILDCQVVFKDGFIEQILVQAKVPKRDKKDLSNLKPEDFEVIKFGNTYSIGIATFRNLKDLENIYLFEEEKKILNGSRVIVLGDLIDYTKILQEDTRDYSPMNQKISFKPDTLYTLFKEPSNKLLEFRAYTDLAGIDENSPNGLIQTELVKRIVTNARRVRFWGKYGLSWGTYIEPIFTLSKIENKFKYLTPDTTTAPNGTTEKFSSPLKLYQYQFLQVGSRVNLLYVENRVNIFDLYLNGFFSFGMTKFRDTVKTTGNQYETIQKNLTTLTAGFEAGICFFPEKRYSFGMSDRCGMQIPLFGDIGYYSVKNYPGETGSDPDRWINTFELNGYIFTSDRGKIFARYRFNHQLTDLRNNFSQFQLGYSIYILDRSNK